MSEEILKALMQLFAIIVKQDEGVELNEIKYVKTFLTQQLGDEAVLEYIALFYEKAGLREDGTLDADDDRKPKLTSVKDSVKILGLCKKINKKLNQKQKVVVLVRLFELINTERKFSEQRMAIINTVAEVFNITKEEFVSIETFVIESAPNRLDFNNLLIVTQDTLPCEHSKIVNTESLDGNIYILYIKAVELFFLRYSGKENVNLNGQIINYKSIYLFANGSTIRIPKGKPIYYSDIVAKFLSDSIIAKLSYTVENISYQFSNGELGLRNISFSETHGKLVGIMGASGAGKTTMLNSLSGISTPTQGRVLINGIDLHHNKEEIEGLIGYIPQDDLLIEELTVFQNLYFTAKQCFNEKSETEITQLVDTVLKNLGLYERKDLTVGSPMNKLISGGQRKRLNIALELIREPAILFVDEPTSGLSSRDSENVMDLLRELALKGKLIFVVIHQPSSEIYKMFDKMMILDTGGYMVYYGNPVEAILYFKEIDHQINNIGECPVCGNVNPESIFDIIEAKVVDEFGNYTDSRKVSPKHWEEHFREKIKLEPIEVIKDKPVSTLDIPTWFKQFKIYLKRDWLSKISNKQYIAINLIESPLLGFILSYIIRYIANPNSEVYIFRENVNIPPYIFMSVVVALFIGLTVSAEEIFKDRKILKREAFLNLSRSSYLISKVVILFGLSAIQTLLFVLMGNTILGIEEMYWQYWLILFSISAGANMMGLNISSSFNSAVTIYILIPLLIIPQLSLGGAMFSFEKLNKTISSIDKVPIVAEVMTARWGYEALMVKQYKDNRFEKRYYDIEKKISIADFKLAHYIPYLETVIDELNDDIKKAKSDSVKQEMERKLQLLRNEFLRETKKIHRLEQQYIPKSKDRLQVKFKYIDYLTLNKVNDTILESARDFIKKELDSYYSYFFRESSDKKEKIINYLNENRKDYFNNQRKKYHNESLQEIVKKIYEKNPIIDYNGKLVQQIDPIYMDPEPTNALDFRTHFFAPRKHIFGKYIDTYWFNTIIIWLITIGFYITLYYNVLKKTLDFMERIKIKDKLEKYNLLKKIKLPRIKLPKIRKIKEQK